MKIQFGCGKNRLVGWQNYDKEVDIRKPLPFRNEVADMVFSEHCIEHVTAPQGYRFMVECYRILKPMGVIRLCVPIISRVPLDKKIDLIVNHGHQMVYCFETLSLMLRCAGFGCILETVRDEIDGHWREIGKELDDFETLRVTATKLKH